MNNLLYEYFEELNKLQVTNNIYPSFLMSYNQNQSIPNIVFFFLQI
jgi:hypothetical protein